MTSLPPPADHVLQDAAASDADDKFPTDRRQRRIIALIILAGVTVVLALWILRPSRSDTRYITQPVTRGDLTVAVTATGTLQPTNQVEVGSEISGKIDSVLVDYNDTVKVGQVLARIDTSRLEAQVKQSRAALSAADAKVLEAQATRTQSDAQYKRLTDMRAMTNDEMPSDTDLEAARATLERAEADLANTRALVAQSRATLDAQRTDLSKAVIRSPINGVVLQRSVEAGQTVAASLQAPVLFVLAEDLRQMELDVDVDEADVSTVKATQHATFTVDAFPDRQFAATVEEVHFGARTVSGVVTYQTVLTVDNSSLELRPGMTATANIVVNQVRDALLVPNAALRFAPAGSEPAAAAPSGGGLVGRLIPRLAARRPAQHAPARSGGRRLWILDGANAVAIDVHTGATDGVNTQIVSGDLRSGAPVIVDSVTPAK
jgi:HlyD family secretion protein